MLRIDVPKLVLNPPSEGAGEPTATIENWVTHFYGGNAIFSITPSDVATVMRINRGMTPPARYALPAPDDDDEDEERIF